MKGGAVSAELDAVECSMCGDVGLPDKLFLCKTRDCHRHQHTYCSNWYPEERCMYAGMCNWCAAAATTAEADGENLNGTSSDRGQEGGGPAASTSGTMRKPSNSAAVPLKTITSNNMKAITIGSWSEGGATPKVAAAWLTRPPGAMRTSAGRRYKLVSEM